MNHVCLAVLNFTGAAVEAVLCLKRDIIDMGVVVNSAKAIKLPAPADISLFRGVGIAVATRDGVLVVGVLVGTDAIVGEHALSVVVANGVQGLSHLLSPIQDKQLAMWIATKALMANKGYLDREVNARLSRAACERADHGKLWELERTL